MFLHSQRYTKSLKKRVKVSRRYHIAANKISHSETNNGHPNANVFYGIGSLLHNQAESDQSGEILLHLFLPSLQLTYVYDSKTL